MNRERLEKAIEVLEQVNPKTFDLRWWRWDGDMHECGFVACAVGHCAGDPWFQEQGLQIICRGDNIQYHDETKKITTTHYYAVGEFFDIPSRTTHWLFDPDYYINFDPDTNGEPKRPTIQHVIGRIRQTLDRTANTANSLFE